VQRLNDRVLETVIRKLPLEYAAEGRRFLPWLRTRRDELPRLAREFYAMLAREPVVRATERADSISIRCEPGSVHVRFHTTHGLPMQTFERTFVASETRSLRLFLLGGDDRIDIGGSGGLRVTVHTGGDTDIVNRAGNTCVQVDRDRQDGATLETIRLSSADR
jgi:hypothetical protein